MDLRAVSGSRHQHWPHRLVLVMLLMLLARERPRGGVQTTADGLYTLYRAGALNELAGTAGTREAYATVKDDLRRLINSWRREASAPSSATFHALWLPSRVGFVFEMAALVRRFDLPESVRVFQSARELLDTRPIATRGSGALLDGSDDFEIAVHRAALSMLCDTPPAARSYLEAIADRVAALSQLGGPEATARLVLAKGMIAEVQTLLLDGQRRPPASGQGPVSLSRPELSSDLQRDREREEAFASTVNAFGDAARLRSVGAEAEVRRGFTLYRWGKLAEALRQLDHGLSQAGGDDTVRYWGALFRGRVLQALDRPVEAIGSFEQAAKLAPQAQTPAVALAALLLGEGRVTDAGVWAERARNQASQPGDPWWTYWHGDARFYSVLRAQIRGARP